MIGRNFLDQSRDDGERYRAIIVKYITEDKSLESNPDRIRFIWSFNDDQYEEIHAYDDILRHIKNDNNNPDVWKFKYITAYKGPLARSHSNYKWCLYNDIIEW